MGINGLITINCHNPYFNRWFSAMNVEIIVYRQKIQSHNPYFNRWFSAIYRQRKVNKEDKVSQSLF